MKPANRHVHAVAPVLLCALAAVAGAETEEGPSLDKTNRHWPLVDIRKAEFLKSVTTTDPNGKQVRKLVPASERVDGGIRLVLDLGDKRVNWNRADWRICTFDKPLRLPAHGGVRLEVATKNPRNDVGVYLALREADGTWRHHPWAVSLTQETNAGIARFVDFIRPAWVCPPEGRESDENARLDTEAITAVAIGTVNPLGIGKVTFTLRALEAVEAPPGPAQDAMVEVTGRLLDVNGQRFIPAGVFGGFHGPNDPKLRLALVRSIVSNQATGGGPRFGSGTTHICLNCAGERIWPSPLLTDSKWREKTAFAAGKYAAAAKDAGKPLYVEFWNEPYLNWAKRERANFIPRCFNLADAKEGGEVRLANGGELCPHLRWTKDYDKPLYKWCSRRDWRRGRDAKGQVYSPVHARPYHKGVAGMYGGQWTPDLHPPLDVRDGETYIVKQRGKEMTLTAFTPWHIYDETQFTYWAGRGMLKFYIDQMQVFGPTLKKAMPNAMFFAGWGLRPSEDKWACFRNLYQPTIDAGIAYIDGLHGHDYGSGPLAENACAEVLTAYGVTRHNKWLKFVNTEMRGQIDPQAYPQAERQTLTKLASATWLCRKILHGLHHVPGKLFGYCQFDYEVEAAGMAFQLLNNLRGRMVQVKCDQPGVYAVAAVDGADPNNPRPDFLPKGKELVLAVLNDNAEPRDVLVLIGAPAGTKRASPTIRRLKAQKDGSLAIEAREERLAGELDFLRVELAPRETVTLTCPLTGELADGKPAVRRQFFARPILTQVTPAQPLEETVAIDPALLSGARRAWVRIVAENLEHEEAVAVVNGERYPLPACVTPDNAAWIRDVKIDPSTLTAKTKLELRIVGKGSAGFFLGCASVIVEK